MSNPSMPLINPNHALAVTPPEEGAGAAYQAVLEAIIKPLGIAYVDLPMDMAMRVLTNGKAVSDASKYVKEHPTVTYVKGPGITPRDDQVVSTIAWLEKIGKLKFTDAPMNARAEELRAKLKPAESEDNLQAFATEMKKSLKTIGSPNAMWRSDLQANLSRGTSDALAERSQIMPPPWNKDTPLMTYAFEPNARNRQTVKLASDDELQVVFVADGETKLIGKHSLSAGTPVRLYTADKASFNRWVDGVLDEIEANGAEMAHGMKQTVLKIYDGTQREWLQDAIEKHHLNRQIAAYALDQVKQKLNSLLVDDLFSRLSTSTLTKKMAVISPNHSYSHYVHDVWEGVKERGGFKAPRHSEIVRASATGDHYKAIEYKADKAGMLKLLDGKGTTLAQKSMNAGDLAMVTHFDFERMKSMILQSLENANNSGHNHIIFGFDDDGDYYTTAIDALHSLEKKYPNLTIEVMDAAPATAKYLTSGVKDTVLMLGNIHGDFATDIELSGKGTSYSTGTISGGRGVVELGSGGTAPDLIQKWRESGTLVFNPMSFVEGISLAMRYAAQNMKKSGTDNTLVLAVADALEAAMYATTDQGIVVPIVKGKFRKDAKDYTVVSTQTFVKSVELEALKRLKGKHPAATDSAIASTQQELSRMIAVDKALFAAQEKYGEEWKKAVLAYNEAREKAGQVDLLRPDYTIVFPANFDLGQLTPKSLTGLEHTKAA